MGLLINIKNKFSNFQTEKRVYINAGTSTEC